MNESERVGVRNTLRIDDKTVENIHTRLHVSAMLVVKHERTLNSRWVADIKMAFKDEYENRLILNGF
jgi:hypothetical protein